MKRKAYKALDKAIRKRNHYHNILTMHEEPEFDSENMNLIPYKQAHDSWSRLSDVVEHLEKNYLSAKIRNHLESIHLS